MDDIKRATNWLRESLTKYLEEGNRYSRYHELGGLVREQVVRLLKRKDLRINMEILLHDLRNTFSGFETIDQTQQRLFVEDALHVIEQIELLITADKVLNTERMPLPDPPEATAAMVQKEEKKIRQEEQRLKERLRHEEKKSHLPRRGYRTPGKPKAAPGAPPEEKQRDDLVFADSRRVGFRRSDRRNRDQRGEQPAPRPAGEGAKKPAEGIADRPPLDDRPKGHSRRRPRRKKK